MLSLIAAVQSGADAVYLGGELFSARAGADNFTNEEIIEAVKYCHLRGVSVHVALNTLIKQDEFDEALRFAAFLYNAGVDAIIIQDLGLATRIKKEMPDMVLHASTQMTVHNAEDAIVLKELGFSRVVVARELSFDKIIDIKKKTGLEVEMFVHGAICQSFSGQCLLSSILGGRSGNRGRCAQPCRLEYELLESGNRLKKGYLLSPKDMCLIEHIKKIKEAGIDSLKIEGRLKRSEYVATVVSVYRKYLDTGLKATKEDITLLFDAFNRSGFTDGYFTGKTGSDMMSYKSPSNTSKEKFSPEIVSDISENSNKRKVLIDMSVSLKYGREISLTVTDEDKNSLTVTGDIAEKAKTKPADVEFLKKQLSRLGNTVYLLNSFTAEIDSGLGVGSSALNELRRKATDALDNLRTKVTRKTEIDFKIKDKINKPEKVILTCEVHNKMQAEISLKYGIKRIYAPENYGLDGITVKADDILFLPEKEKGKLLSSHLCHGKDNAYADFRLNVFNTETINALYELGFESVCLSPELNLNEIKKLSGNEVIGYGKLPVMLMKNCVIKAAGSKCAEKCGGTFYLKDRKNEKFLIMCNGKKSCTNTLLNSKPVYMADKAEDLIKANIKYLRLVFTDENEYECETVLKAYTDAFSKKEFKNPEFLGENKFTRGHFYRGVM